MAGGGSRVGQEDQLRPLGQEPPDKAQRAGQEERRRQEGRGSPQARPEDARGARQDSPRGRGRVPGVRRRSVRTRRHMRAHGGKDEDHHGDRAVREDHQVLRPVRDDADAGHSRSATGRRVRCPRNDDGGLPRDDGTSHRNMRLALRTTLGLDIALGTIVRVADRAAAAFGPLQGDPEGAAQGRADQRRRDAVESRRQVRAAVGVRQRRGRRVRHQGHARRVRPRGHTGGIQEHPVGRLAGLV